MNLSLTPRSTNLIRQRSGPLAKVYTKDGRSIRVPLQSAQSTTCTVCSQQPERQFMQWFTRQSAANPGFPVMVKSILLITNQNLCANCQRILTSFLYRNNLAGKLRLGSLQSNADSIQQQVLTSHNGESDQENEQEFSRFPPMGRSRTARRSWRPLALPRRGRPVVHILQRPLITGYQADLLSDRIYNIEHTDREPAYIQNPPDIEDSVIDGVEPLTTSDEVSSKSGSQRTSSSLPQPTPTLSKFTAEAARYLQHPRGLTELANQIKGRGQMRGATVEIALASLGDGRQILVAGINSSATWTAEQLAQLRKLGINEAPQTVRGMKAAPHAEENIAAYLISLKARGERWSKAIVGAQGSYVCSACRVMIKRVGGTIEQ